MFFQKLESIKMEKQFKFMSEIIDLFDLWLATRPKAYKGFLTPEQFAESEEIMVELSTKLFQEAEQLRIIKKRYVVVCPNCEHILEIFDNAEESIKFIIEYNENKEECTSCEKIKKITAENVFIFYNLIELPCKKELTRNNKYQKVFNLSSKSERTLRDEIVERPQENIDRYGSEVVSELLTGKDISDLFGLDF